MDKDLLIEELKNARENAYGWSLYFFKIDRRNSNPFTAYKVRFKNCRYLPEYAKILIDMVIKYQMKKINEIKEYTGKTQRFLVIELKQAVNWLKNNGIILLKILRRLLMKKLKENIMDMC